MPKYKIKEGQTVNLKIGSRKDPEHPKQFVSYKGGESVELSAKDALVHASVLDLSDAQEAKLKAEVESESAPPPAKKK